MPTILEIKGRLRAAINALKQARTQNPSKRALTHAMGEAADALAPVFRLLAHPTTKDILDQYTETTHEQFVENLVRPSANSHDVNADDFRTKTILFYVAAQSAVGREAVIRSFNTIVPHDPPLWNNATIENACARILGVEQWIEAKLFQRVEDEFHRLIQRTSEDDLKWVEDSLDRVLTPALRCPLQIDSGVVRLERVPLKLSNGNRLLLKLLINNFDHYVRYDKMGRKHPHTAFNTDQA